MILLKNVSKIYSSPQGEVRALHDLTLEIREGEYVAVRGKSGCGKSTLLSLLGGLTTPTSGTVEVGKHPVSSLSSGQRAAYREEQVGFVFQMFHLLPYLNVLENVLAGIPASQRKEREGAAEVLLERFQMGDRLSHRPGQLSAGERQRTALARALVNQPKLLLADEPTGNLDPENTAAVLEILDEFHDQGGVIVLATHDDMAAKRAQRIVKLEKGGLLE